MNVAFLSLGGNMGNRRENLQSALFEIERLCGRITKKSTIYETAAWGSNSKRTFYNMVVKLKTVLGAAELLEKVLLIEKKLGRKRNRHRNADRNIDIDILFFNTLKISNKNLQIPHPRLELRKFVLIPLNEIASNFKHPVLGKTVAVLTESCKDTLAVKALKPLLSLRYICIEGNIGSGKTTLAKGLAQKLGATYLPEHFEENSLLPLFYEQPKQFAFPLEYSFLISRFMQIQNAMKETEGFIVADYSFYKSLWFAKVNLPKREFDFFEKHFDSLSKQLPAPELLIHLTSEIDNLQKNIEQRGRVYEQNIKKNYLKKIQKVYKTGVKRTVAHVLDCHVTDYGSSPEKGLINTIEKYIKENFG